MTDPDDSTDAEREGLGELFVSLTGESTVSLPQEAATSKAVHDTTRPGASPAEEVPDITSEEDALGDTIDDP